MRTVLLFLVLIFSSISVNAQTVVDSKADTVAAGVTSLREAVESANDTEGIQTITFDPAVFPVGGGIVIYLDSTLYLTDAAGVIISGAGAEVILDGGEPAPGDTTLPDTIFYSGFVLESSNNDISGLYFKNFGVAAIEVDSALSGNYGNNIFKGNEIWYSGTGILANTSDNNEFLLNNIHDNNNSGIEVDFSANNTFYGNLLAFNGFDGLTIYKGTGGNNIEENIVLGNSNDGLSLSGGMNNNNFILRNNIGDSSFVPAISVPALQMNNIAAARTETSNIVNRNTLLTLNGIRDKSRLRSIESRDARPVRKSVEEKAQLTLKKKNEGASLSFANGSEEPDRITRERKEKIPAVRSTIRSEGGSITAFHTGNGNAGINLYGVNNTYIEDNLISNSNYVGLYIEGYFQVDSIFSTDTTLDTTYYFPYGIYVNDNRFVRNSNADIEFCYIEGLDVTNNSFRHSYEAIYGYGSFGLYPSSPMITGGIVNVKNNDYTSSAESYFFEAYYLFKANMYNNVISSIYVATELSNISIINIHNNHFTNTYYSIYVDVIDSLFVKHNNVTGSYAPFEMYTDSGYMEIMYNELTKSVYGMDFDGCFLCFNATAIVSHNKIQGIEDYGITGYDMGYVEISENYIKDVVYYAISLADIGVSHIYRNNASIGQYPMLALYSVDSVYVEDNIFMGSSEDNIAEIDMSIFAYIKNNTFRDGYAGVDISRIDSLYFGYNEIANTMDYGLYLSRVGYGLVDYNKIYGHMYTGVYAWRTQNLMLENNDVSVNGDDGIYIGNSSNTTIRYNSIMDNNYNGIAASTDTNLAIYENFISLNEVGIYVFSGIGTQRANNNSFFRNLDYGIMSNIAFDGKHNFWGHPDGPTIDAAPAETVPKNNSSEFSASFSSLAAMGGGDHVNTNVDADSFSTTWEFVPLHSPDIKAVNPRGGPREGGIRGKLHGDLFLPGVEVFFGGTKANLVDYYASNVLEFDLPVGIGGPVDVIVKNTLNNKSDTLFAGFAYANEAPAAATLELPANNSNVSSLDVQFGWQNPVDPDGDALEYTLIYSTDEDFPDSSTVQLEGLTNNIITLGEPLLEESDYFWKVIASDTRTGISESVVFTFKTDMIITGVDDDNNLPKVFSLSQNYPNPFNPTTTIKYALPKDAHVRLVVYNLLGRQVATLVNNKVSAGFQSFNWDARNMASGVYIYQITAGDFRKTRKMVLLK